LMKQKNVLNVIQDNTCNKIHVKHVIFPVYCVKELKKTVLYAE
jgi:hypothetical protein